MRKHYRIRRYNDDLKSFIDKIKEKTRNLIVKLKQVARQYPNVSRTVASLIKLYAYLDQIYTTFLGMPIFRVLKLIDTVMDANKASDAPRQIKILVAIYCRMVKNNLLLKFAKKINETIESKDPKPRKPKMTSYDSMPWVRDAGVKGMKKGQHVKAHDPDYVESLKGGGDGGGGAANGGGANNGQPQKQSKWKKALKIGAGVAGGLAAAALLANGAGRLIANRQMAKKFAQKKLAERAANKAATQAAKARTAAHINKMNNNLRESQKTWGTLTNTSKLKEALGNPNHVFDI